MIDKKGKNCLEKLKNKEINQKNIEDGRKKESNKIVYLIDVIHGVDGTLARFYFTEKKKKHP